MGESIETIEREFAASQERANARRYCEQRAQAWERPARRAKLFLVLAILWMAVSVSIVIATI